ncbi:MAG: hypothetical protein ANABAC_1258 [Anaerolineae bacterium]|nr:MAG: hypothetical protein ANABAC_1258 [Anaerolineae bacterium]
MQLEVEEPAHRTLALRSEGGKYLVLVAESVAAHGQGSGVNE